MLYHKTHRRIIAKCAAVLSSCALLGPLALANTICSGERTSAQQQIAERLDSFERTAASTRTELDHYAAAVRSGNPHMMTHAGNLDYARENVNLLGKQMSELEKLNTQGTALQQAVIREARPHLELLADHVQDAIVLLNEGARGYRSEDFRKAVNGMYEQADRLYTKVDTLTDFEKACNRAIDVIADSKADI
jgi:DNA repair ATPase RecN